MNIKEIELVAKMLNIASDIFSNHGCNDVDEETFEDWTEEERRQLVKEYHEWNGDPEEYNEDENILYMGDWVIMDFMAHKLRNE